MIDPVKLRALLDTFFDQARPWKIHEDWTGGDGCDWSVNDASGHQVADCGCYEELAEFVERAGNALPLLLDVFDAAVRWRTAACSNPPGRHFCEYGHESDCAIWVTQRELAAAIDKARSGT